MSSLGPMEETPDELASLTKQLDDIEAAMERLDQGTYGRCQGCGTQFDASALERNPVVELCVNCAQTRNNG